MREAAGLCLSRSVRPPTTARNASEPKPARHYGMKVWETAVPCDGYVAIAGASSMVSGTRLRRASSFAFATAPSKSPFSMIAEALW
jgi:hypothetical protein